VFNESVDFIIRPAVRTAGDVETDTAYNCADEDVGCPDTRWALCALNSTQLLDEQVAFLTCFDGLSLNPPYSSTPSNWTSACSVEAGLDFEAARMCHAGPLGDAVLHDAAVYFERTFPAHAHSGEFKVPHVFINDDEKYPKDPDRSLSHMTDLLCAAGALAPVCSQNGTVIV